MYFIIMVYILLRPLGTSSINGGGVCLRTPYIKQKKCQLFTTDILAEKEQLVLVCWIIRYFASLSMTISRAVSF